MQFGETTTPRGACVLLFASVVSKTREWEMQGRMMDTEDHIRTIVEANSYQNLLIVFTLIPQQSHFCSKKSPASLCAISPDNSVLEGAEIY